MTDPRAADVAVALNDRNAALSERQAAADLPELPHPRDETALDVGAPASGSSSDGPPASPTAPASPNKKKDVNISSSGGVGGITAAIVDILDGHNDPEYSYMDVVDPDLASRDAHLNENQSKLVNTIQFITRGHAVPWKTLTIVTIYSAFIVVINFLVGKDWVKNNSDKCSSRWWCSPMSLDPSVIGHIGFALFLLLGFRVNDSYARWQEGTRIWNDDIAGTIAAFCTYFTYAFRRGLFHAKDRERVLGLVAGYAVSLKRSLRDEKDLRELESFLPFEDINSIQKSDDMPGHCLYLINGYLISALHKKEVNVPGTFHNMLMKHVQTLAGLQGMCMRIKTYKVAYGYRGHLKIFLAIWFMLLPLALVETSGWVTILWVPFICYGIVGMDAAADELSDPFGYDYNDIRLGIMTNAIMKDIRSIYTKSLTPSLEVRDDSRMPDMLNVPEHEGGRLPGPVTKDQ